MKSKIIVLIVCFWLMISVTGCDAFVRKFTRKPKKDNQAKEEMVLAPEEYRGPQMSREELYRQYFLYWKSWQDELINALSNQGSQKKQLDCIEEAIKNLSNLRGLLSAETQKKLDGYILEMSSLKAAIEKDFYNNNTAASRMAAERLKRNILRDFSYHRIKNYLI